MTVQRSATDLSHPTPPHHWSRPQAHLLRPQLRRGASDARMDSPSRAHPQHFGRAWWNVLAETKRHTSRNVECISLRIELDRCAQRDC